MPFWDPVAGQGFARGHAPDRLSACTFSDILRLTSIANVTKMPGMSTTNTMNIALPEPMRAYVASRVESGQYGNTSEYVRELIRRDQREQSVARLRAMVEDGLASGPARADTEDDWAELDAIARGERD